MLSILEEIRVQTKKRFGFGTADFVSDGFDGIRIYSKWFISFQFLHILFKNGIYFIGQRMEFSYRKMYTDTSTIKKDKV